MSASREAQLGLQESAAEQSARVEARSTPVDEELDRIALKIETDDHPTGDAAVLAEAAGSIEQVLLPLTTGAGPDGRDAVLDRR